MLYRAEFNEVMSAPPPVTYDGLTYSASRLVNAHRYFAGRAREWLQAAGEGNVQLRASAVERSVCELMQMVVIDLTAEENAQEIFETLNARGAQLTAADLIKNFVFQRLTEAGDDVENAYDQFWKEFETGFWESEVRFKVFADFDSGVHMRELLRQIGRTARLYRSFVTDADTLTGPLDRLGMFAYRTGVLESEIVKPLVLYLLDPDEAAIPAEQLTKALDVVESWLVRRMLVRATSKSYTQVVVELIGHVRKADRQKAGDVLEEYLAGQTGANWYWPDDDQLRRELATQPVYRRLSRGCLRMVLEAIED